MKRLLSMMLAVLFVLTGFGVTAIFEGFLSAGAFYDYLVYDSIPGFSIFTDEELALMQNAYFSPGVNETIEGIGDVVTWTRTGSNTWGGSELYGAYGRNMKKGNHKNTDITGDMPDATWAAKDTINGKTVLGVVGSDDYKTFADQDGVVIWVGINGQPFTGKVSIRLWQVPCCGPFYINEVDTEIGDHTPEELADFGTGFQYCSRSKQADENGYIHFDFKTDFYQADWWSVDDEGNHQQGDIYSGGQPNYHPVPESKIAQISAFSFGFDGTSVGDKISVGDIRMYHDSRLHLDELEEYMGQYDVLNPEAYTEESYEAATEVYLEAYDAMYDPEVGEHYSQKQINNIVKALKAALKALQPMFMRKSESVLINGFDSLTEDDIDAINDGGVSIDAAMLDEDVIPDPEVKQSIAIIGGAFDGDPSYGWSQFSTSALNDDDEVVAVGNVFGSENLEESAGLRFWIKYGETYGTPPTSAIVGVGSSADGVYFECDPEAVSLPASEGYVGVAWYAFYDIEGDEEIYDYLGSLDYFTIKIEECSQKEFYLSDLHAFEWSINAAAFTEMDQKIIDAQNYLATLNKDDWSVRSWQRAEQSIDAARALHDTYAVTQQEVDKAIEHITRCLNWLTPRGQTPTQEEIDALEAAYYNALTYWRGNYTGKSFADLKATLDYVGEYIDDELNTNACLDFTRIINEAVAALVPITNGGTVAPTEATDSKGNAVTVKLFSLEDFSSNREFNKANGHRVENVGYDLVTSSTSVDLPAKALKMTAQADRSSKHTDQHGAMQFKLANYTCDPIHPDVTAADGNTIGGSIGDLSGSAGIRIWVGVNDVTLAKDAFFRFGVSNCQEGPLFEKHAVNIPFPTSGSGWLYIPWECFDYYDDWTHGVDINLAEIRFIIIRVDGEVPQGLEVYATCVSAYTDPAPSTNATPVIKNVTEGQSIDVAGASFVPKWDVGTATLNGKRYVSGTPIDKNDDYILVVTNGDKQTSVNFTVTGGIAADSVPVIAGVAEGGEYDGPVTITWDVGEGTLNGEPIEKGAAVEAPGDYLLEVVNGTKSTSVRFTIKGAAVEYEQPVISGVENGGEYDAPVVPTWTPAEATATLNGEAYAAGTEITAPGEYVLVVTNGDKSATVSFTVKDQTPPPPEYKRGDMDGDN
ncbi:MAG: hypothetical protein J5756_00290, partial [Clostridia bacterium]|nr:hypothetical protein [Clostridia bacterium]